MCAECQLKQLSLSHTKILCPSSAFTPRWTVSPKLLVQSHCPVDTRWQTIWKGARRPHVGVHNWLWTRGWAGRELAEQTDVKGSVWLLTHRSAAVTVSAPPAGHLFPFLCQKVLLTEKCSLTSVLFLWINLCVFFFPGMK